MLQRNEESLLFKLLFGLFRKMQAFTRVLQKHLPLRQ